MRRGATTRSGLFKEATAADIVFEFKKDYDRSHYLPGVHFSYDADPAGAYLLIEVLDAEETSTYRTIGKHFITDGGPGPLEFVAPYETPVNTGLRVTLKSGGGTIKATLDLSCYSLVGVN